METIKIRIEGPDISPLTEIMKNRISDPYIHSDDKTLIVATESYFFRINSNLMTVMILRMVSRDQCKIDIISGGGSSGFISSTCGAESSANAKFIKFFKEVCESSHWQYFEETK